MSQHRNFGTIGHTWSGSGPVLFIRKPIVLPEKTEYAIDTKPRKSKRINKKQKERGFA